jgi:sarcosine dehydrogenase
MSYFGKLYICGPETSKAVDYIFTSRIIDREINRTVYTCMLNKNGGVEADCTVTGLESGLGGIVDPIFKGKAFYIGMFIYLHFMYCILFQFCILLLRVLL